MRHLGMERSEQLPLMFGPTGLLQDNARSEIGYSPKVGVYFPLPMKPTLKVERHLWGETWTYKTQGEDSVPYTVLDRLLLAEITTMVVREGKRIIELGSMRNLLALLGRHMNGTYTQAIQASLWRVFDFTVEKEHSFTNTQGGNYSYNRYFLGEGFNISWLKGSTQTLPEFHECIQVSEGFYNHVRTSGGTTPHVREHYLSIRSPFQMDVYRWLLVSLHGLVDKAQVHKTALYRQFVSPEAPTPRELAGFWFEFKKALWQVKYDYYAAAMIALSDDGNSIILKKSDPLIDARSPKAGLTPA